MGLWWAVVSIAANLLSVGKREKEKKRRNSFGLAGPCPLDDDDNYDGASVEMAISRAFKSPLGSRAMISARKKTCLSLSLGRVDVEGKNEVKSRVILFHRVGSSILQSTISWWFAPTRQQQHNSVRDSAEEMALWWDADLRLAEVNSGWTRGRVRANTEVVGKRWWLLPLAAPAAAARFFLIHLSIQCRARWSGGGENEGEKGIYSR